jgi:hypothetical protein
MQEDYDYDDEDNDEDDDNGRDNDGRYWEDGVVVNLGPDRLWLPPIAAYQIAILWRRQAGGGNKPVEYCPTDGERLEPYVGVWRCSCGYRKAWTEAG